MSRPPKKDRTYEVELMISRDVIKDIFGADYSHGQYPLLLHLVREVVGGDITPMDLQVARPGRRPTEYTSLGLLSVGNTRTLLDVIDFTWTDNEISIGPIRAENGDSVYVEEDIDEELAKAVGGEILKSDGNTSILQISTDQAIEFNKRRGVYDSNRSVTANAKQQVAPSIDRDEISEQIEDRAEAVNDQLEHIPDSYSMPDPEDMTIGSAKKFSLGVVFVDIAGFTDYAQRNTEKDVLFMLNMLIPEIMETVRDTEGDFEKNTGDGILAYFGAGESDARTAHLVLTYIATIKTVLADYINPILEDNGVVPVSIKVGAAMGDVHISRIGVNRLNRRTVVGETANIASKLEDEADKHEYFISQEIQEAAVADTECMWASALNEKGTLPGFKRDGEAVEYYDFRGVWSDTDVNNFVA